MLERLYMAALLVLVLWFAADEAARRFLEARATGSDATDPNPPAHSTLQYRLVAADQAGNHDRRG